jgi:hypothetical protein
MQPTIQYISDEQGHTNAVIIPIALWENIKPINLSITTENKQTIRQRAKQRMKQGYPLNIAQTFQRDECYER